MLVRILAIGLCVRLCLCLSVTSRCCIVYNGCADGAGFGMEAYFDLPCICKEIHVSRKVIVLSSGRLS